MVQARLLDIAIREFGVKGLDGASTRAIAKAADTVMSSITYHYGGKQGLYLAAADRIAEKMTLAEGELATPTDGITANEARARLQHLLAAFVDKMIAQQSADWALFIMREQMNPTEAFDHLWGGLMGQSMERLVTLVRLASGGGDERAARVAAITMMGQVVALRASRASCLKLLRQRELDPATGEEIKRRIAANIDATLDALAAERQEPQ